MPERFDASSGSGDAPSNADLLRQMQSRDAVGQLHAVLDQIGEMVDRSREDEARDGVPPEVVAALVEVTGAPDAPPTYQSLRGRIAEGRLTWLDFWLDPRREPDGPLIVRDAIAAQTRRLRASLDDLEAHPEEMAKLDRDLTAAAEQQRRERRERDGGGPGGR